MQGSPALHALSPAATLGGQDSVFPEVFHLRRGHKTSSEKNRTTTSIVFTTATSLTGGPVDRTDLYFGVEALNLCIWRNLLFTFFKRAEICGNLEIAWSVYPSNNQSLSCISYNPNWLYKLIDVWCTWKRRYLEKNSIIVQPLNNQTGVDRSHASWKLYGPNRSFSLLPKYHSFSPLRASISADASITFRWVGTCARVVWRWARLRRSTRARMPLASRISFMLRCRAKMWILFCEEKHWEIMIKKMITCFTDYRDKKHRQKTAWLQKHSAMYQRRRWEKHEAKWCSSSRILTK